MGGHQPTGPLWMFFQAPQFFGQFLEDLPAVKPLPFRLFRVEANDITTASHPDFLDLEVFADLLKPAGMGNGLGRVRPPAPGHGHDVPAAAPAETGQIVGAHHPGVSHENTPVQPPAFQILFDPLDRRHISRVAGKDPGLDGKPVPGHGHSDDHLRSVRPAVFGIAPFRD